MERRSGFGRDWIPQPRKDQSGEAETKKMGEFDLQAHNVFGSAEIETRRFVCVRSKEGKSTMFGKKKIQVDFDKLKYYDEFEKDKSDASIAEDLTGRADSLVHNVTEERATEAVERRVSEGIFSEEFEPQQAQNDPLPLTEPLSLHTPIEEVAPEPLEEPTVLSLSEPVPSEPIMPEDMGSNFEPETVEDHLAANGYDEAPESEAAPLELSIADIFAQVEQDVPEPEVAAVEVESPIEETLANAEEFPVETVEDMEAPFVAAIPAQEQKKPVEAETDVAQPASPIDEKVDAKPAMRRSGRTKTRLLGFEHSDGKIEDIFANATGDVSGSTVSYQAVGWIVVVSGPGRGHSMPLNCGVSQIGRGDDQAIQLDFGDNSISRSNHASIAYDEESRQFFIGHGGKSNIVRLNDSPVLSTEKMVDGDRIRMGETTLQLVAFCDENFSWSDREEHNELNGAREESSPVSAY